MKILSKISTLLLVMFTLVSTSCEREEGPGGSATIVGKVWVVDYNSNFTKINEEYFGQDERVFICYGNDTIYSDKFDTDYNGNYRFDYLTKGDYTIYAMSKDKENPGSSVEIPVKVKVSIDKNGETVQAEMIVINK